MASQVVAPPPVIPQSQEVDSFFQRGLTKCKQQPLVPLGAIVTTWALLGAVREFKRGNSQNVNRFLRFRVVAQGATVAAMLVGSYVFEQARAEQKEQDALAERERMFRILDSVGNSKSVLHAAATEKIPEPIEVAAPIAATETAPEKHSGRRYVGTNDKLMEFFNRRQVERGAAEGAPRTTVGSGSAETSAAPDGGAAPKISVKSGGWFPWSSRS